MLGSKMKLSKGYNLPSITKACYKAHKYEWKEVTEDQEPIIHETTITIGMESLK